MASPSDSARPTTPTASSPITGVSALWTWLKNIGDWIKALSPTGTTAYDTGWVTLTYSDPSKITAYSAGQDAQIRRIGKQVYLQGASKAVTAGLISGATAATTVTMFNIPGEFLPAIDQSFICQGSGLERWLLTVSRLGYATASRYSGSQGANAWLPHSASWAVS